jgi:hypothetical protein
MGVYSGFSMLINPRTRKDIFCHFTKPRTRSSKLIEITNPYHMHILARHIHMKNSIKHGIISQYDYYKGANIQILKRHD